MSGGSLRTVASAVAHSLDGEAFLFQVQRRKLADVLFVIDHQHRIHGSAPRLCIDCRLHCRWMHCRRGHHAILPSIYPPRGIHYAVAV